MSKLKVAGSSLLGFLGSVTLGVCATFTIQMNDRLQFVPVNQTVLVGDTVTWTNVGIVPHTSTSGTNKVPSGLWDSGSIGQHGNFSFTFNGPGDYVYYCTPHVLLPQHMQAQITVASPNLPPLVSITNPITGASFASGSVIQIQADASDPDGTVARVDFFANGQPAGSAFSPPYTVAISTLPPGAYALTAVATDNAGASGSSSAVNITVIRGIIPPTVTITNPISGRAFIEGSNVVVEASAVDTDGVVTQVEFFLNNLSVGIVAAPPYAITLSNLALGDYVLSALATDNDGATSSSPAVTFSVITRPDAPRLLEPLPDRTVVVGSNVAFFASADGSPPLFYQWQFNGTNLVERTDDTLTLTNVSTTNAGAYAVVLSNVVGSVTSPPAILTVVLPPDIRPEVTLTSPQNGARFPLSGTVSIIADATDLDGTVAKVQFFLGRDFVTNSIGIVTNAPFRVDLVRLAAGTYFVSAVATDNRDGTGGSPVISFSILQPTEVTLNRKPDGTNLVAGTAITLTATNSTFGTTVTKVEYFDGAVKVGEAASQPYTFVWKPATGLHFVSAMATDDLGQTTNSTPQQVRIFEPDAVLPKVVITNSPPNFTRFDSPEITLAGVASDNTGLDRVEYQINDAAPSAAKGKETWKLTAQLQGGLNTVRVRSIDLAGNISLEAVRFYTYAVRSRLGLTVRGDGRVTPALNGKLLEVGKTYQITARPASGQIFAGWEGSSKGNVLSFRMEPGLSLVATFMPNPFGALAGRYTGLYMSTNKPGFDDSGFFTLQLAKQGAFSGKLTTAKGAFAFHGRFDGYGTAAAPVLRPGLTPLLLGLQLNTNGLPSELSGSVTRMVERQPYVAELVANRNVFSQSANRAPHLGPHLFSLASAAADGVQITGTVEATVYGNGQVKLIGLMEPGGKFSIMSALSPAATSPLYARFTEPPAALLGWLGFGDGGVSGKLVWLSEATNQPPIALQVTR